MKKGIIFSAFMILVFTIHCSAQTPRMEVDTRWSRSLGELIADFVVTDVDGDGRMDVIVGLSNNSVISFNHRGTKIGEYFLGNASRIGRIYSMALGDVNGNGQQEVIFGLGGARDMRTYDPHDFQFSGGSVTHATKVLYRIERFLGSVIVTKKTGEVIWRNPTLDSVRSVGLVKTEFGSPMVVAGVGDLVLYTYNQATSEIETRSGCIYIPGGGERGWTTQSLCLDEDNCCPTQKYCTECSASWDDEHEICHATYIEMVCGENLGPSHEIGWEYVTYRQYNGSVFFYGGTDGRLIQSHPIVLRDSGGNPIRVRKTGRRIVTGPGTQEIRYGEVEVNNGINHMVARDINGDGRQNLLAASRNGEFYALEITNIGKTRQMWKFNLGGEVRAVEAFSRSGVLEMGIIAGNNIGEIAAVDAKGKLMWKQRIDGSVMAIEVLDIDGDETVEIVMVSQDRNIYVLDETGNILSRHNMAEPLFNLFIGDMDINGLVDIVISSERNITRLEMDETYMRRLMADRKYESAYEAYYVRDYTKASAYIDMATRLYEEIDDRAGLQRCAQLRARIDDQFRLVLKGDADKLYNLALNYYAINELDEALENIQKSRGIYSRIDDEQGIEKCDRLTNEITDDIRMQAKIRADGMYARAVSLSNFGDYMEALELLEMAGDIFEQNGFLEDSIKAETRIISIGDKHMEMADSAMDMGDYEGAIAYGNDAKEIYLRVQRDDLAQKAHELVLLAEQGPSKPFSELDPEHDMMFYMGIAILVLLFLIILINIRSRRRFSPPKDDSNEEENIDGILEDDI